MPSGWHLPGGIVRLGETLNERVRKVGLIELGVKVKNISLKPIDFNQIILNQDNRSHFFSFLFSCELSSKPPNRILYKFESKKKVLEGQYNWFDSCPKNILKPHLIYKKYLNRI